MPTIIIDDQKCLLCGRCVATCPASLFVQATAGESPDVAPTDLCIACGHCLAVCPTDAITHDAFPEKSVFPVDTEAVPNYAQTLELLRSRRSVRVFTEAPVSRELVTAVLEAARLAPTAHNLQEVRYTVVQDKTVLAAITKSVVTYFSGLKKQMGNPIARLLFRLAATRSEVDSALRMLPDFDYVAREYAAGRDPILHDAPCILIAHSRRTVNFPESNAAIALHNAALAAHALGLGGFLLGYVVGASKRSRAIPDLLGIPRDHEVYSGLALGHPAVVFPKWIQRRPLEVDWDAFTG